MNPINITFNIIQQPWTRPVYMRGGKESKEVLVPSLKADFQEDISNEFFAEINRKKLFNRFPRQDNTAIFIIVKSSITCNLSLVVKNVIDALNRKAYKDDVNVTSIYAMLEYSKEESIAIGLCLNHVFNGDEQKNDLYNQAVIKFEVKTQPIDIINNIPKYTDQIIYKPSQNIANQAIIKKLIRSNYAGRVINEDVFIKCYIDTKLKEVDVDNIYLNYLIAMTGTIIVDQKQVKKICMNLNRGSIDKASFQIQKI
ncbi:hypothetical protein [Vallitalea guaymasensis]|uniref:hypothetical protein n=1 Tax=Vallitalea guaymasensis TaxID=1185412 RepID=UPI000DE1CC13|nr:hypothetical protein [Vallitalea guaymasensis]